MRDRLKSRTDTEHEQAAVRVIFPVAMLVYLYFHRPASAVEDPAWTFGLLFASGFLLFSLLLFLSILAWPGASVFRRVLGMSADIGVLSTGLIATDALGAPWYAIYLWVTFGNGFRFGERYLYLSALISIVGFSFVLVFTPYWQDNLGLGLGLLAALFVLPGYAAFLIRRINVERQRAEAANRAKSEFLARMSHEMRTPLNGVIVTGELLRACPLGPEEREYADTIAASGTALLNLIEDILDIAKIEEGKLEIERTAFDLHALVNGTLRMLTPQAAEKGLHLASHVALDTPYRLIGDPLHLRQVLINLIGNAIKFTERGRVELICRPVRRGGRSALIRFEVEDTGIGIPLEMQEHIFDKFTQADGSTTRRFGGSGLGTTIAKQLVELMNGRIGVRSTPNLGSTFWFDIEFELQPEADDADERTAIRNCRVLRLAQDPARPTSTAGVLASWQIPVVETATAVEAVARLVEAAARGAPFEILIVEGLDDAATYRVLDLLEGEPEIAALGVLLVLEPGRKLRLAEHYRNAVHTLEEPLDTGFLFNALHAFQGSRRATTDVISLFERVAAPQLAGRPLNILVADDNAINRMLIGRILDRAGHRHVPVANGREALEALESSRFDLVVIDMRMPDIGGLDTFKMFRFAHPTNETPFIMVTADATTGTRQACAEAGIGHFLTKPISAERLLAAVEEAYRPGARRDEGPREPTVGVAAEAETVDARLLQDIVSLAPDEAFLARLLQNFLDDSRALLETMGRALEAGDDREFEEAAHALKGAAANFALPRLSSLAYGAEQLAGEALGTEGPRSLASLRNELDRSTEALRRALPGTQAAV